MKTNVVLDDELVNEAFLYPQDDIPEVEYPPEVISRLDREFNVVKAQLATGELRPMSAAEIAAEFRAKKHGN